MHIFKLNVHFQFYMFFSVGVIEPHGNTVLYYQLNNHNLPRVRLAGFYRLILHSDTQ